MNRHCKQQLQKFGLTQADITHVCITPNLFPFLQYLLLMDDDIVFNHTYYFVNELVPEEARNKIPCSSFEYYGKSFSQKLQRRINKIKLQFLKYIDYPFLSTAEIYAYDVPYLSLCIGKRPYSLLSDAPNWVTLHMQPTSMVYVRMQQKSNSLLGKIQSLIYGDLFVNYLGNNKQCKTIYLTEENKYSPILEAKKVCIQPLDVLYSNSSDQKRKFIMKMFHITPMDIDTLNKYPIIFFSQPLMNDCGLTEEEYIEILQKIFAHYSKGSILIKTHPRDTFEYNKFFPEINVFTKVINSQLLYLMGVSPQRIVTISSTAIEGFPETIECDYFGVSIHPKVEKYLGNNFTPRRKVNHMINRNTHNNET